MRKPSGSPALTQADDDYWCSHSLPTVCRSGMNEYIAHLHYLTLISFVGWLIPAALSTSPSTSSQLLEDEH